MSNGADTSSTATPVNKPASTGSTTTIPLPAFTVDRVNLPEKWDPSSEKLSVGYDVTDVFGRIKRRRVLYIVDLPNDEGDLKPVVIHEAPLTADQLRFGCHEVAAGDQWDGTISKGIDDRIGEKVTGELAPITVKVEAWNTADAEPGTLLDPKQRHGRTDKADQYYSRASKSTNIDIIVIGKWGRSFIIPFDDPDEPKNGLVTMKIKLKNVAEGSPVGIQVLRITDTSAADDEYYTGNGDPDLQPGLEAITVAADGRALANGKEPEVRFNNYESHWKEPGNNFFRFEVSVGTSAWFVPASSRDVKGAEHDCLHLRFTVFIFSPAPELGVSDAVAAQCHQLFRNDTKYWRSFHRKVKFSKVADFKKYIQHRYAVIYEGHGGAMCFHDDHPKDDKNEPLKVLREKFAADDNVCPIPPVPTPPKPPKKPPKPTFGGCGNKEMIGMFLPAGKGISVFNGFSKDGTIPPKLYVAVTTEAKGKTPASTKWEAIDLHDGIAPRLVFWNDACRTIITTNFAECMQGGGTRYYHGYRYISLDNQAKLTAVFKGMIKGTKADPRKTEYETDRFGVYYGTEAVKKAYRDNHPRLSDDGTLSGMVPPPDAGEAATK